MFEYNLTSLFQILIVFSRQTYWQKILTFVFYLYSSQYGLFDQPTTINYDESSIQILGKHIVKYTSFYITIHFNPFLVKSINLKNLKKKIKNIN